MFGKLFFSFFDFDSTSLVEDSMSDSPCDTNPATGLPMVGGVDVAGNPFGCGDSESSSSSLGSLYDW